MVSSTLVVALLALGSTSTEAANIPPVKRAIYGPGTITSPGHNISAIVSWSYAALAHATVTISNNTNELTYLCTNFDELSSRYYTAFAQPNGDVAKLAKEAICDASRSKNPSPLPVPQNMLWYMKMYTAGILNVQAYSAKKANVNWYFDMCIYLETSLLRGLWAPCLDTDEGGVDVESGFCATAGYFGKGPFSKYTNATQPTNIAREADTLMSKFMARVFMLLVKDRKQIDYVCKNWGKYQVGMQKQGLVASAAKEIVCGQGNVIELKKAQLDLSNDMTELFIFQILHAGNKEGYNTYLCDTYSADILSKYNLDGARIIDAFCKATS